MVLTLTSARVILALTEVCVMMMLMDTHASVPSDGQGFIVKSVRIILKVFDLIFYEILHFFRYKF